MSTKNEFGYLVSGSAGARTIAFIIDTVAIGIFWFIVNLALGEWLLDTIFNVQGLDLGNLMIFLYYLIFLYASVSIMYYIGFEAWRGQTIGKMLLDLVTVEVGGTKKIGPGKAAARGLYKAFMSSIGVMQILDFAFVYEKERSVGDYLCGTIVVEGNSWRQQEHLRSQKVHEKEKASTFITCTYCGNQQVPVYADGSGICPACKNVFSK